jgi:hypothetical protein
MNWTDEEDAIIAVVQVCRHPHSRTDPSTTLYSAFDAGFPDLVPCPRDLWLVSHRKLTLLSPHFCPATAAV